MPLLDQNETVSEVFSIAVIELLPNSSAKDVNGKFQTTRKGRYHLTARYCRLLRKIAG